MKLIATDLDGTLLRSDLTVSDRTRRALRRAGRLGMRHLVVTGRSAAACRPVLSALGYTGLAVCGQGAQIYDAGADRLLRSQELDRDLVGHLVERLYELSDGFELAAVRSFPDAELVATAGFTVRDVRSAVRRDAARAMGGKALDRLLVQHPGLGDDELVRMVTEAAGTLVAVTQSENGMVEVLPPDVDKGRGVALAATLWGLDGTQAVAFGDMPNDIPMLRWAGHAVAMGNCHPDVLAVADEVAPHHDHDGVAHVLERLLAKPDLFALWKGPWHACGSADT